MAAPVAAKIQLPSDAANTGPKTRTQTRVVGADTVHETFVVVTSQRSYTGLYWTAVGNLTLPTAVQTGTTSGNWWLFNPIGSTIKTGVRRWSNSIQFAALAVDLVPGQFRISRFTYTGTPSGAAITVAKRANSDATPQTSFRSAMTGMTITLIATVWEEQGPILPLATGSGVVCGPYQGIERDPNEDGEIILAAGEGLVHWSALALTTANRRLTSNIGFSEFE